MPLAIVPVALFGLVIGSFLNVVAHRLPLGGSLVKPRSQCPSCMTPVRPYDNVPVLSWLLLRGRCRSCSARISPRYPLVEAGTALLWIAVAAAHLGDPVKLALGLVLVTFLVPLALIDLDHQILPNKITYPAMVVGLVLGTAIDPAGQPERLLAAAALGGTLFVVCLLLPQGMGVGDAKLLAVLGLFLGWAVVPALFIGLVAGTLVGVVIVARVGMSAGRKTKVPFGVFLALGGVAAIFVGDPLIDAYLSTLG